MSLGRSLTLIGLTANVFGAVLVARYDMFARIKPPLGEKEDPDTLSAKNRDNLGWGLFIAGFCFQIIGLWIDP